MNIPELFEQYEFGYEKIEQGVWRSTFADEQDEEYDLYVAVSEGWLHFVISPFTPPPVPACQESLQKTLLHLNQSLRLVRFAIDGDGDVTLQADLPLATLSFSLFAATLDTLLHYTRTLGRDLACVATDPGYHFSFP